MSQLARRAAGAAGRAWVGGSGLTGASIGGGARVAAGRPALPSTSPAAPSFASWARQAGLRERSSYQRDIDPQTALYSLIGVNVAAFAAWQAAERRPGLRAALGKHAVVSPGALRDGRVWTLLTSAFSHRETGHLLVNMVTLYFFGGSVARTYGGRRLVGLYLAAGAAGSAAHAAAGAVACARAHPTSDRLRAACVSLSPGALGASGAVNGVLALSILANPRATVLVRHPPRPGLHPGRPVRAARPARRERWRWRGARGAGGRALGAPGGHGGRGGGVGVEGEAGAVVRSVVWLQGIFIFSFLFCSSRRRRRRRRLKRTRPVQHPRHLPLIPGGVAPQVLAVRRAREAHQAHG